MNKKTEKNESAKHEKSEMPWDKKNMPMKGGKNGKGGKKGGKC